MRFTLFRRAAAGFLALLLCFSLFPVRALAAQLSRFPADVQALLAALAEHIPEEYRPEALLPRELPPEDAQPELLSAREPADTPRIWFGQLHAHSSISDGTAAPEAYYQQASGVMGLDFFALTDHSDSFDNALQGSIDADGAAVSADWAAGRAAAAVATTDSFLGLYGYEMSWPAALQIGHIASFATPGFVSWQQEAYRDYDGALTAYYEALASVPGAIGQFNHPGTRFGDFHHFEEFSVTADRAMTLIEVIPGDADSLQHYLTALDNGWHLAPVAAQDIYTLPWEDNGLRTAVAADSLQEDAFLDALRSCRAYATEDPDLQILYTLSGHFMGSQITLADIGSDLSIEVTLSDPTDGPEATVEVLTSGGTVLAAETAAGSLSLSLPAAPGYYFLRITQTDGDTALTAPVWVDAHADIAITGLRCDTAVPVQNSPVTLSLTLENRESSDFTPELLEILADGRPVYREEALPVIPAHTALPHSITTGFDCMGLTELTLRLTGTLRGSAVTTESSLTVSFHQQQQVTGILVDGSHGNAGLSELTALEALAAGKHIRMEISGSTPTMETLKDCRFLLVSAPSRSFSPEFLATAAEFAAAGGSIVLCGQADLQDTGHHSAAELNRLLAAVGSTLALRDDILLDTVNNGGSPELLYTGDIDRTAPWCAEVTEDQVWRHAPGCSVDPGRGTALVRGLSTAFSADGDNDGLAGTGTVMLASEALSGGGTVFVSGCLFCSDDSMAEAKNIWDEPYANRTIARTLLGIGGEALPLSTIRQARTGEDGALHRIRGYVTGGTSNPCNTFPDTLYLQDDTGGIAVMPFSQTGIQTGTPMEITGYVTERGSNKCLKPDSWQILDADYYNYEPLTGDWGWLLEPELCGGVLVEAEGICQEIYCRADGTLTGCLLKDDRNRLARVSVGDFIGNGSDGSNDLHKTIRRGRTVRAAGILHVDEYGDTVLRVRNCQEVVWVPPQHLLNPATGDLHPVAASLSAAAASLTGLLLIIFRRKRR